MQTITNFFRNILTIAVLILTVSAINAAAATFTVTNTNDSGAGIAALTVNATQAAQGKLGIILDKSPSLNVF